MANKFKHSLKKLDSLIHNSQQIAGDLIEVDSTAKRSLLISENQSYPLLPMELIITYRFVVNESWLMKNAPYIDSIISRREKAIDVNRLDPTTKKHLNSRVWLTFDVFTTLNGKKKLSYENKLYGDLSPDHSQLMYAFVNALLVDSLIEISVTRQFTSVKLDNADFVDLRGIKELRGRTMSLGIDIADAIAVKGLLMEVRTGNPSRSVMQFDIHEPEKIGKFYYFSEIITSRNYKGRNESP